MKKSDLINTEYSRDVNIAGSGPDPEVCGLPILCIFYGLLLIIIITFLYQTIKGERDFRKHHQIKPHMSVVKR